MDMKVLLAVDCGKAELTNEKSLIRHPHARTDTFAARLFGR